MEKKLAIEVEQLKANYPDAEIQLWCEDEHRLGLKPVIRRVYVPSILFHRCQSLLQQQDLIQGLTGFHWWIQIGA